jgi:tetratricopeptide (TPR) repeat protein
MSEHWFIRTDTRSLRWAYLASGAAACIALTGGCTTAAPRAEKPKAPAALAPETPPTPVVTKPSESEAALIAAANDAASKEDYETALRTFRELLQDNPTLSEAYTGMGSVYEKKGDLELAEPAYARAVALDPGDFTAVSSHGRVLEALGRVRDAVLAYQRALVIRPRDVDSNLAMSRLMLATGQADSAVVFADRAVKIDAQNGKAHLQLARSLAKAGRGADSIKEYEASCELFEPSAEVVFELVNAYAAEKRYREAANAAETLTRTAPSAAAYERLGWALFRLNEFEKSDAAYRKSIEIDAAYWPALNGVGVNALNAWVKAGKSADDPMKVEARAMLQRSLKANPDQPKVAALLLRYRL